MPVITNMESCICIILFVFGFSVGECKLRFVTMVSMILLNRCYIAICLLYNHQFFITPHEKKCLIWDNVVTKQAVKQHQISLLFWKHERSPSKKSHNRPVVFFLTQTFPFVCRIIWIKNTKCKM